jgi:hypothetical protein
MSLGTLGTSGTTSLAALNAWGQNLSDADIAAIGDSIVGDGRFSSIPGGGAAGASGILATGSTHLNTTLDTLVATGGAGLGAIQPGMLVLAANSRITPGTYVAAILSATSVQLSKAAASTTAGVRVAFVPPSPPHLSRYGLLTIPGRGILKVLPGDVVALDNTGWAILVSGAAIAYAGSLWSKA